MADIMSSSESIGLAVVSGVGGAEGARFLDDLSVGFADSDAPDAFLFLCEGGMVSLGSWCLSSSLKDESVAPNDKEGQGRGEK